MAAVTDPAVLAGVIPGCDGLTPLGAGPVRLTRDPGRGLHQGLLLRRGVVPDLVEPSSLTHSCGPTGPGRRGRSTRRSRSRSPSCGDAARGSITTPTRSSAGWSAGSVSGCWARWPNDRRRVLRRDRRHVRRGRTRPPARLAGAAAAAPVAAAAPAGRGRWDLAGATAAGGVVGAGRGADRRPHRRADRSASVTRPFLEVDHAADVVLSAQNNTCCMINFRCVRPGTPWAGRRSRPARR